MSVFVISYDLRKPDHNYDPVWGELERLKAKRIQESVWVVKSDKTAKDLFEKLWPHFHNEKDRLVVVGISSWWGIHLMSEIPDF